MKHILATVGALTVASATAVATVLMPSAQASSMPRPIVVTGGQHTCSYTNPEFMLTDWNAIVRLKPGTTWFHADWTKSRKPWNDAYWVTGWHNENSVICERRQLAADPGKYGQSFTLPIKASKLPLITADLKESGDGRLGFDLWFARSTSETGPRALYRDSRTYEVMIDPGPGFIRRDNPGWHRVFVNILPRRDGILNVRGLDLTSIIRKAGVPGNLYLMAIDAGAELTHGSFTMESYGLHIAGQHPKVVLKHKTAKPKPRPVVKKKPKPKPVVKPRPVVKKKPKPKPAAKHPAGYVQVPKLTGRTLTQAVTALKKAHLGVQTPGAIRGRMHVVTSQSVKAGVWVRARAIIRLHVTVGR